ncbi:MAG: AI-2E family transporter [Spirochaetes bacterium]|nr:AI-2E family transporter [Spirochaetota bacterium]
MNIYYENMEKNELFIKLTESKKLKILFFILLAAVSVSIIYIFSYFFWPFLFALILYIALKPVYNFSVKYLKYKLLCSTLVIISIIFFVMIPLFFILLILANQAYDFYLFLENQFQAGTFHLFFQNNEIIKKILSLININQREILQQIIGLLSKTSFQIFSNVTSVLSFSIKFVLNLLTMLLILFFLFKDSDKLSAMFYRNLPFPEDIEKDIINRLNIVIKVLFAGNIFIMIAQGFVVGIGFWVFGFRMPLLWAVVTAILSLIPGLGTPLIWIPAVIYLAATGSYISAMILGLWCLIGYLLLENIVKPKLFGKKLNFHPLIFFFLLIGSIQTFNLPGVIIGPVLLSLFFSLWELYKLLDKYSADNKTN